jgi:hypothetical protein
MLIEDETVIEVKSVVSERKGWDGTVKGGNIVSEGAADRKGWDGTVKGGSITTEGASERKGWDGTVKGGKATSEFLTTLNELDQILVADKKSSVADLRIAKENSARLRSSIQGLVRSSGKSEEMQKAMMAADTDFAILLGSVNRLGESYKTTANALKTRHDTVKNSVGNVR